MKNLVKQINQCSVCVCGFLCVCGLILCEECEECEG
jgi:hypothetical protein